jgi:ubiquinone/menaquinone biosynthesis C-methylase UbiE
MCHDSNMNNACAERFNRTAEGYLRWWAPVLAPASVRLVDRVGRLDPGLLGGEPRNVVDVGCGTGTGLFEAARRWPGALLTGLDASVGMLDVARREQARLPESARERISYLTADAAAIPAADASLDVVTTCFVLQQVPDRALVLREILRVLRPGGILAIYGWVKEKFPFAPEAELENALAESGVVRPPVKEVRSGHYGSVAGAAAELRSAGFRRVAARAETLDFPWHIDDFIEYRTSTRDVELFESLDEPTRRKAVEALRRRLDALTPDQLVYRPPIVSIVARKP